MSINYHQSPRQAAIELETRKLGRTSNPHHQKQIIAAIREFEALTDAEFDVIRAAVKKADRSRFQSHSGHAV